MPGMCQIGTRTLANLNLRFMSFQLQPAAWCSQLSTKSDLNAVLSLILSSRTVLTEPIFQWFSAFRLFLFVAIYLCNKRFSYRYLA